MEYVKLLVKRGLEITPVDCREDKVDEIVSRFGRDSVTMLNEKTGLWESLPEVEPEVQPAKPKVKLQVKKAFVKESKSKKKS